MAEYEKEVSAQGEYKVEHKEEVHHGGLLHHNGVEYKEEVKIQQHHGEEYKEDAHKHGEGILGVLEKEEAEGNSGDEVKVQHIVEVKHHAGLLHQGVETVEYKEVVKVQLKHDEDSEHEKHHGSILGVFILGVFKKHEHVKEYEHHGTNACEDKKENHDEKHDENYKKEQKHNGFFELFKKHDKEYNQEEVKIEHKEEVEHHGGIFHHGKEYKEEIKVEERHDEENKEDKKHHSGLLGLLKKHEPSHHCEHKVEAPIVEPCVAHPLATPESESAYVPPPVVEPEYVPPPPHLHYEHQHKHHDDGEFQHKHVEKEHHGHHNEKKYDMEEVKYKHGEVDEAKDYA